MPKTRPLNERFWEKVKKTSGCWEWQAFRLPFGYGQFGIKRKVSSLAHRFSWQIKNGPIPKGLCVLHKCDNPPCVNPSHLFVGTHRDNISDKIRKNRTDKGEKHGMSKLKEYQVYKIRELYSTGKYTHKEIADKFNISREQAGGIIRFDYWGHLAKTSLRRSSLEVSVQ